MQLEPALNAFFIALAAGAMIFVSVHELLPMAARFGNRLTGARSARTIAATFRRPAFTCPTRPH